MALLDLVIPLFMDKEDMHMVLYYARGVINNGRVWHVFGDGEGPKALPESENDGVNQCLVRMCGEMGFKAVNVDWSNKLEEMGVVMNCSKYNSIVQFIGRRCR